MAQPPEVPETPFRVAPNNSPGSFFKVSLWFELRWFANVELHRIPGGQELVWIRGSHPCSRDVRDLALPEPLLFRDLLLFNNTFGCRLWLQQLRLPERLGLLVVLSLRHFPLQLDLLSLIWLRDLSKSIWTSTPMPFC